MLDKVSKNRFDQISFGKNSVFTFKRTKLYRIILFGKSEFGL